METPEIWRDGLRDELALIEQKKLLARRADTGALPADQYGAIEDIVLLGAIDELLKRVWHKDSEHYRKGRVHLGALAFHLREELRKNL